ncbi:hypothetical protein OGM63_27095 [Plectonema radiosum NIES-515]|uniref:Uncharacterized protein n=1 Tax=Plectonema radiosum NIES-515 TaxID=2986073 RepID=A0ABT3B6X9_9CYAN|nr:hypothetical protein [Plectonema radiosum]MCV3217132.1 hypothetical protein [Plectonema radiosum NIES-515]
MTHFKALVILPQNTINIRENVAELLSPYYSELVVEPYKEYLNQSEVQAEIQNLSTLSKENIEELIEEYEVYGDNLLESLAKIKLDWYEEEIAGIDEYGAYRLTTLNPCSKWDWYDFIEVESRESKLPIGYPCRVADLPNIVPYALITPNGQWYEAGAKLGLQAFKRICLLDNTQVNEEEVSWDLEVQKILASYSDYLAVAIHCHI